VSVDYPPPLPTSPLNPVPARAATFRQRSPRMPSNMAESSRTDNHKDGLAIIHVALYRMGTRSLAEAYRILGYKAHHVHDDGVLEQPWSIVEQAAEATWPAILGINPRLPFQRKDWEQLWDPKVSQAYAIDMAFYILISHISMML
jgi:hypothetical protein